MKTKKKIVSLISILLIVATMVGTLSINASAASVSTSSSFDARKTVSFTVKTGSSSPSIKFTSTAATVSWKVPIFKITKKHTCAHAPKLVLKVSPAIDGKNYFFVQDFIMTKSVSSTLKMKKNTTYTISVYRLASKENHCLVGTDQVGSVHVNEIISGYTAYCNGTWKMSNITNAKVSNIIVR